MKLASYLNLLVSFVAYADPISPYILHEKPKLVVVNVSVKDKAGNPVTNLNKGDFELLEDGVKQSLSVFDLERLSNDALPPVALNAATGTLESRTALANEITAPTLRHDDKRLLALFFDNSSLQQSDQVRDNSSL